MGQKALRQIRQEIKGGKNEFHHYASYHHASLCAIRSLQDLQAQSQREKLDTRPAHLTRGNISTRRELLTIQAKQYTTTYQRTPEGRHTPHSLKHTIDDCQK